MNFEVFINNVYTPKEACSIRMLLQEYEFYSEIANHVRDFYESRKKLKKKDQWKLLFVESASKTTQLASRWLQKMESHDDYHTHLELLMRLLVLMCAHSLQRCRLQVHEIYDDLHQLFNKDKFLRLNHSMNFKRFTDLAHKEWLKIDARKKKKHGSQPKLLNTVIQYIDDDMRYEPKVKFEFFIDALVKIFCLSKQRKALEMFFSDCQIDFKIILPREQILLFLTMLCELHKCGRLKCKGNRGLFKFAQQHIQSADGLPFTHWKDWAQYYNIKMQDTALYEKHLRILSPVLDAFGKSVAKKEKKLQNNS
ncbi:MAG: hypothetical protein WCL06_10220 [Bacteroidota bacterium]